MLFCEKCNYVTEDKVCPSCGSKKLRPVCDKDFCYFTDMSDFHYEIFESALKDSGIDVVGVPFYHNNLVTHINAGRASERRVYIRYGDTEKATEIFETIFVAEE